MNFISSSQKIVEEQKLQNLFFALQAETLPPPPPTSVLAMEILLSFLLRCGTRPYERGTQWDSNSLV